MNRTFPVCRADLCEQGRRICPTPQACQAPEAAHAASELDDEPHDCMTSAEKRLIVVIYVVSAVLVVMLGAHALAWWGVL